jgi:hypothetical protein
MDSDALFLAWPGGKDDYYLGSTDVSFGQLVFVDRKLRKIDPMPGKYLGKIIDDTRNVTSSKVITGNISSYTIDISKSIKMESKANGAVNSSTTLTVGAEYKFKFENSTGLNVVGSNIMVWEADGVQTETPNQ